MSGDPGAGRGDRSPLVLDGEAAFRRLEELRGLLRLVAALGEFRPLAGANDPAAAPPEPPHQAPGGGAA